MATWLAGWAVAGAFLPRGRAFFAERVGWGFAIGTALLALLVVVSLFLGVRLAPIPLLVFFGVAILLARRFRLTSPPEESAVPGASPFSIPLLIIALLGLAFYGLRALTEPMWSNDFQAVWGLKGKTIFGEAGIPLRLFESPSFGFSHPEYPLGLPLVYSGIAFLLRRWEDHAMALFFPFCLLATLLVLYGWLRRRGATQTVALAAAALLSHSAPLYSAFLTGMAEIPLSFALLLVGMALSDALDRSDSGAVRRLAVASLVASGVKNEGLFFVGAALLLLLFTAGRRRTFPQDSSSAVALFGPAALSTALHRLAVGNHPLRDLDFGLLLRPGLPARVGEALEAEWGIFGKPGWLVLLGLLALLLVLGRRARHGERLLILAGMSLGAYLVLPVFCVYGPLWLVTWTTERTVWALAPLVTAGLTARVASLFREEGPLAPAASGPG